MKLTGDLKKKVEAAGSRDEARKYIEDAGMELTDYELEIVSGGGGFGQSGESVRYRALCKTPVKEYPNNRAGALRTIDAGQVIDRCGYPTLGNDGLSWYIVKTKVFYKVSTQAEDISGTGTSGLCCQGNNDNKRIRKGRPPIGGRPFCGYGVVLPLSYLK